MLTEMGKGNAHHKLSTSSLNAALNAAFSEGEASATTAPKDGRRKTALGRPRVIKGDSEACISKPVRLSGRKAEVRWLRWLVRFAQQDAVQFERQNWEPALREFAAFAAAAIVDFDHVGALGAEHAATLARELHAGVDSFLDHGEWETPVLSNLRLHLSFGAKDKRPQAVPIAPLRDTILVGVVQLLARQGYRLRRCAADGCPRVFLAKGRQIHCSKLCREREGLKAFIKRHGGEEGYAAYRARKRRARLRKHHAAPNLRIGRQAE